jgi:GH25 family lysozyme M1 (1,4-beta-N-acetylmuramidase)
MTGMKIEPIEIIDVSKWQPNINWACMEQQGVRLAFTRGTVSVYYTDATLKINMLGMKDNGIRRVPYHVTRADKTLAGMNNSAKVQMDYFAKAIEGLHDGIVCLDVELALSYDTSVLISKQQLTDVNMDCWELARQRYDEVYWYSRTTFMDGYMAVDSRFKQLDLFLAEYGKNDGLWYGATLVPRGCTKDQIVIHQFTGKGEPFCCDPIVNALDYDLVINRTRFNEMHKIDDSIPTLPPTGNTWDEARIALLENEVKSIKTRLDEAKIMI